MAQPTGEVAINGPLDMGGTVQSNGSGTDNISSAGLSVQGQTNGTPISFNCPFDLNMTFNGGYSFIFTGHTCGIAFSYP